jgi:hypothetical protein
MLLRYVMALNFGFDTLTQEWAFKYPSMGQRQCW